MLLLHYGHMIISATLDVMNPLNEQYATSGNVASNKNENISTILAFAFSAVYAVATFFLIKESSLYTNDLTQGFIKLFIIGLAVFVCAAGMFYIRVKAYYYER